MDESQLAQTKQDKDNDSEKWEFVSGENAEHDFSS